MSAALILGGASTVYADVEAALALGHFDGVLTCNAVTARWPGKIDAAVSLHPGHWGLWIGARDRKAFPRPDRIVGQVEAMTWPRLPDCITEHMELRFPGQTASGSSGLFALKVALVDLGFDKAVLCGVPLTEAAGHIVDGPVWPGAHHYHQAWREAFPQIKDRARSMGGWTATLLGQPDAEWIG